MVSVVVRMVVLVVMMVVAVLGTGASAWSRTRSGSAVRMRLVVPITSTRVGTGFVVRCHVLLLHLDCRIELRTVVQVTVRGRLGFRLRKRVVLILLVVVTRNDAKVLWNWKVMGYLDRFMCEAQELYGATLQILTGSSSMLIKLFGSCSSFICG